jgi:predicted RNase H-like nuclease
MAEPRALAEASRPPCRIVGVDLAWGARNDSGLCVIEDGRVLASACLRTDDEIEAWIRRWWTDDVLVAFDAPLIVRNATGRRPCEGVCASAFAAEHAGPYPANLSVLRHDVRAARLAQRLGLDTAPDAFRRRPMRAAIEVFPHPALVVFLNRAERLPYKAKQGRALTVRHGAMDELITGLLALKRADPPLDVTTSEAWPLLAAAWAARPAGAALKRLEDELDAHVCAYIGMYHLAWAGKRSLTVGDGADGYIVVPVTSRHATLLRERAAIANVMVT